MTELIGSVEDNESHHKSVSSDEEMMAKKGKKTYEVIAEEDNSEKGKESTLQINEEFAAKYVENIIST